MGLQQLTKEIELAESLFYALLTIQPVAVAALSALALHVSLCQTVCTLLDSILAKEQELFNLDFNVASAIAWTSEKLV